MPFETAVLPAAPAGFETPLLAIAVARGRAAAVARGARPGDRRRDRPAVRRRRLQRQEGRDRADLPAGPGAARAAGRAGEAGRDLAHRHPPRRLRRRQAGARRSACRAPRSTSPPKALGGVDAGRRGPGDRRRAGAGRLAVQRDEAPARGQEARARADRRARARPRPRRSRPATGSARRSARGRPSRAASRCCRATSARRPTWRRPRRRSPQRHGFGVTVLDKAAIVREKMGALHGGGAGQRRGAAVHRARVQGRRAARRSCWSARASRSTPAASRSSRRRTWKT